MPFKLPKNAGLSVCMEYVLRVEASLLAEEETKELATPWTALYMRSKEARDKREAGSREVAIAIGKGKAADVKWDRAVIDLSGLAYFHAGKDAEKLPYSRLFGTIKANQMRMFGMAKALSTGKQLLTDLQQLADPALQPAQEKLQKANDALGTSETAKSDAKRAFRQHELVRQELVEDIEKQIILTEIELLKQGFDRIALRTLLSPHDTEDDTETDDIPAPTV